MSSSYLQMQQSRQIKIEIQAMATIIWEQINLKRDNRLYFGELAIQILFYILFYKCKWDSNHWEISWYKFISSNNSADQLF